MHNILLLAVLSVPQDASARIDEILKRRVPEGEPGAAVLVVKHGKVLHQKGYGLANLEHEVPITKKTVFRLASVSKQFTAMGILILMERGKLSVDDDARKTLPELKEHDPDRPIRIRDLLRHTSGLTDYLNLRRDWKKEPARMTNEDVLRVLKKHKLKFPTGTKWEYSNSNYALLALIISRVSGKSFGAFLKDEIFTPLGMKDSGVFERPDQIFKNRAYGYRRTHLGWRTSHSDLPVVGDGAVMTTIEDWVRWEEALRSERLVKEETLNAAFTAGRLDDGTAHRYGYGWGVGDFGGRRTVQHSGGWFGASTYVVRFLDAGLTVVVLSNADKFPSARIGQRIARFYLSEEEDY